MSTSGHVASPGNMDDDRPNILLLTGWNWFNIGDISHTPGFLRAVARFFPEASVTILASSYSEELRQYLAPRFSSVQQTVAAEFKPGVPLSKEMEAAFARADILVLNSGMTLSYGYHGHDWGKYLGRIVQFLYARELGLPFGIWGHSFDRIDPPVDILYRSILPSSEFIFTRETTSLELLRDKGITSPIMEFCPDSTFAFDLYQRGTKNTFSEEHNLTPGEYLVFVPRLDVHRFRDDQREIEHGRQARELISSWVRTTGYPVVIMHETIGDIEPAHELILDQLPHDVRAKTFFQPEYWLPDDCQAIFSQARLLISLEMHSVIMGLAAGVPSFHPYFRQAGLKQWMLKDLGLEDWLFDIDDRPVEELINAAIDVSVNFETARDRAIKAGDLALSIQAERMSTIKTVSTNHFNARR